MERSVSKILIQVVVDKKNVNSLISTDRQNGGSYLTMKKKNLV